MVAKRGFVLIPERRTMEETIALSKSIPNNKLKLDVELAQPHVTVLQTYFAPNFDYKGALKRLRAYRGFSTEPRSTLGAVTLQKTHELEHIVWWTVDNTAWLKDFNRELIEELSGFIIKPEEVDASSFLSPEAEESFRLTGYERNLDAYEPHLTVAVTDYPVRPPATSLTGSKARFHYLAFVEHGQLGEITRVLAKEELPVSWDW